MTSYYELDATAQLKMLEAAGRAALSNWNLQGAAMSLIKFRENAVFRIDADGRKAALRLHRFGYHTDAELASEIQWMQALTESGVLTPDVILTSSGDLFARYLAADLPGPLQIDLFEWIEGRQLGSVEVGIVDTVQINSTYQAIGELAAQVHNQASTWELPVGFVRHAWDAQGLAGAEPFWGQFWKIGTASKSETSLLIRGRDRVFEDLNRLPKSPDTYSMIHADFAPENVLVHANDVRLIDFDDAGFGWHMFELATCLYFLQQEPYYDQARTALVAGYRMHRSITDEQLEQLPLHMVARGLSYVGWVHTRQETPTAREMTPMLIEMACELTERYLAG